MGIETPTSISDLVSKLKSSSDKTAAERLLFAWVKAAKPSLLKKIESQQISLLEKELELLRKENVELKEKIATFFGSVKGCSGEEGCFATQTPKKLNARALFSDSEDECIYSSPNKSTKGVKEEDPLTVKSCKKLNSPYELRIDFEVNPELCLERVCVLYRKQTEDEKNLECIIHCNGRGISQEHAPRGSKIEFLVGGFLCLTYDDSFRFRKVRPRSLEVL